MVEGRVFAEGAVALELSWAEALMSPGVYTYRLRGAVLERRPRNRRA